MLKKVVVMIFVSLVFGLGSIGCEKKEEGIFEKMGKSADDAIEKTKESMDSTQKKVEKAARDLK